MQTPTVKELADYREAFNYFDRDRDSFITTHDLGTALRALGLTPSEAEVQNMISGLDNNNGLIDFNTFLKIIDFTKNNTQTEDEIKEAFKVFDKEGTGLIPTSELKHVLTTLGEKLSDQEADDMIKEADQENSGYIDYTSFVKMLLAK